MVFFFAFCKCLNWLWVDNYTEIYFDATPVCVYTLPLSHCIAAHKQTAAFHTGAEGFVWNTDALSPAVVESFTFGSGYLLVSS